MSVVGWLQGILRENQPLGVGVVLGGPILTLAWAALPRIIAQEHAAGVQPRHFGEGLAWLLLALRWWVFGILVGVGGTLAALYYFARSVGITEVRRSLAAVTFGNIGVTVHCSVIEAVTLTSSLRLLD